jgi:hypothetical protein
MHEHGRIHLTISDCTICYLLIYSLSRLRFAHDLMLLQVLCWNAAAVPFDVPFDGRHGRPTKYLSKMCKQTKMCYRTGSSLVPIRCGLFIDKVVQSLKTHRRTTPQRLVHFGREHL